jgi:hypothetical protein
MADVIAWGKLPIENMVGVLIAFAVGLAGFMIVSALNEIRDELRKISNKNP